MALPCVVIWRLAAAWLSSFFYYFDLMVMVGAALPETLPGVARCRHLAPFVCVGRVVIFRKKHGDKQLGRYPSVKPRVGC